MMPRVVAVIAVLAAFTSFVAASSARAEEEADTQTPAPSPTPELRMEAAGIFTDGNEARGRELLGEPEDGRWSFLWAAPLHEGPWDGKISSLLHSTQEGRFTLGARSKYGDRVAVRAFRTRLPHAFRIPQGGTAPSTDLESAREGLGARWERRFGATTGSLDLDWSNLGGSRPALPAGLAYDATGAPTPVKGSSRSGGQSTLRLQARVEHLIAATRIHGTLRLQDGRTRDTLRVEDGVAPNGLRLTRDDRSQSVELAAGADAPLGSTVLVGGGAAAAWSIHQPSGARTFASPSDEPRSFESIDLDQRVLRQRAYLGSVWSPVPTVRAGLRIDGSRSAAEGTSLEARHLATEQLAIGESSRATRSANLAADADWYLHPKIRLNGRATFGLSEEDDTWSLVRVLPDGTTELGTRRERLDRELTASTARLEASGRPHQRVRVAAGASTEERRWAVTPRESLDTRTLGDSTWRRDTLFTSVRTRITSGIGADLRASLFREERDISGLAPSATGSDLRARVTAVRGSGLVFLAGTISRRDVELPLEAASAAEWRATSQNLAAGAAYSIGRTALSARGSVSMFGGSPDSRLAEGSLSVAFPLPREIDASVTARVLDARDRGVGSGDVRAAVASFALTKRF